MNYHLQTFRRSELGIVYIATVRRCFSLLLVLAISGFCATTIFRYRYLLNVAGSTNDWPRLNSPRSEGRLMITSNKHPADNISCQHEISHIGFVKVHKAGSTTLMNILERYAYTRKLLIALPQSGNALKWRFNNLMPIPEDRHYDMIITHVSVYNRDQFETVLPKDSKYIGIIRDPLELTMSAFEYYRRRYGLYKEVKGVNKLKTYLHDREKYEPRSAGRSFTNNRMSYDFGLKQTNFYNRSEIQKFLERLDSEMDFVIVLEHFAECLVILKRMFCWQIKDILYMTQKKNEGKPDITFSTEELAYHRNFSFADSMLYDHFEKRFQEILRRYNYDGFNEEVAYFKSLLPTLSEYCNEARNKRFTGSGIPPLTFKESPFNQPFNITVQECQLMTLKEMTFCSMSRMLQRKIVEKGT